MDSMHMYGHRNPAFPFKGNVYPQPNMYAMNPNPHQHLMMHPNVSIPSQVHPHAPAIDGFSYGSVRQPPAMSEPGIAVSSYDKDSSSHLRQGGGPVPSWNIPENMADKYYSSVPAGAPYRPFESEGDFDKSYIPQVPVDQPVSQGNWDNSALNQYSAGRLAIYLENANCAYELVESDLRELFSYYSGVHCLAISPDYPAAELVVTDPNTCNVAAAELNGLVLHGIGTLRCVVMKPGQTLQSLLSSANMYAYQNARALPSSVDAQNFNTSTRQFSAPPNNTSMGNPPPNVPTVKTNGRHITYNNVDHVPGITSNPNTRRLCRFELVELFSYEPDFDVTSCILGPNNSNIEYIMRNSNNKVDLTIKGKPLNSAKVVDRLHLSVSSSDFVSYNQAISMVEDMLSSVCEKYVAYVKERGKIVSNLVGFKRHEYEEDKNGNLDYKGVVEKPKTWLDGPNSRRHGTSFSKSSSYGSRVSGPPKKFHDRGRPAPSGVRPNPRTVNPRSRSIRK